METLPKDKQENLIKLFNSNQYSKTKKYCLDLINQYPKSLILLNLFGITLVNLGNFNKAINIFDKIIKLFPKNIDAYINKSHVFKKLGKLEEALLSYNKTLELNPNFIEVYNNKGNTLRDLGRLEEALLSYNKALELNPNLTEVYYNQGNTLRDLGRLEEALLSYNKTLDLDPNFLEAYNNQGNTLKDLGRLEEALLSYKKVLELKPDFMLAYSNFLFTLNYSSKHSLIYRFSEAKKFGNIVSRKAKHPYKKYNLLAIKNKLRVGLVSGDLHNHPVGYLLENILSNINPDKIELVAYLTNLNKDELTKRIKPFFANWKIIYNKNDKKVANEIYNDCINILIDLSGHTGHNRLPVFAWKPAPVQVSWLGYFATTGLEQMNYIIGDPYVTPVGEDSYYTEKVWRMPETRLCFSIPKVNINVSMLPALRNGYITFGCFNNFSKINAEVVSLWSKILLIIPNSKIFFKNNQIKEKSVCKRLLEQFKNNGINNERIILEKSESRSKYFYAYNNIDVSLDPFPFPGGVTSIESLWMGVPVLTLSGDCFLSRQGEKILINADLCDWVSKNKEEYVVKAEKLTSNLNKLSLLRSCLRNQVLKSPLFDTSRFAKNFENALWNMWKQQKQK